MKVFYFKVFLLIFVSLSGCSVQALEPVTTSIATGIAIISSALMAGYDLVKCRVYECCSDGWISPNMTGLKENLTNRLYGQHLVLDTVFKQIKGHINNKDPSKALVLSFHGWTGGGKNYVSKIIVDSIFQLGMGSKYVHQFIATHDFPHTDEVETYKDQLREWIKGNITQCERSVFIFDEMDKMPEGLTDVLKPYLDHYTYINSVSYRKAMFIFLSNTAGNSITQKAIEHWEAGRKREDITLSSMEEVITLAAYNEKKAGLWHSSLIEKNLISAFVPFLPLERHHVKQCIEEELRKKGHMISEKVKNEVADELQYFPPETKLYSKSGCKRVAEKVDLLMEEL